MSETVHLSMVLLMILLLVWLVLVFIETDKCYLLQMVGIRSSSESGYALFTDNPFNLVEHCLQAKVKVSNFYVSVNLFQTWLNCCVCLNSTLPKVLSARLWCLLKSSNVVPNS